MTRPFVSYLRVSTDRQGRSGLGLDAQRRAVHGFLQVVRGQLVQEFIEIESGHISDRPQLLEAQRACKRNGAVLLIAKLDRLARNVAFIANLMESGAEFVAADMPHASKLTIHILAAVAEHEREMISSRTKAALAVAKARGARLGNPSLATFRGLAAGALQERADLFASNVLPIIRDIQNSGADSLRDIAAALNARGIASAGGSAWHPNSVRRVLARSGS